MNAIQQNSNVPEWIRPWKIEKFDNLHNKDERFFSIVIKGLLSWLNRNIILYNKPIRHFIYNTGSSIMYIENNGYEMSWTETTAEDMIYMERPRCVVNVGDIDINTDELSQPHIRGVYERESVYRDKDNNIIKRAIEGYNAEIRRIPLTLHIDLNYVLSNFNESIVLTEELIAKFLFQQYYNIVYLGQKIMCSIELPQNFHIETNKIDMTSSEVNQKTIALSLNICCNYPRISESTEMLNSNIISNYNYNLNIYKDSTTNTIDKIMDTEVINDENSNNTNNITNVKNIQRIKQ